MKREAKTRRVEVGGGRFRVCFEQSKEKRRREEIAKTTTNARREQYRRRRGGGVRVNKGRGREEEGIHFVILHV